MNIFDVLQASAPPGDPDYKQIQALADKIKDSFVAAVLSLFDTHPSPSPEEWDNVMQTELSDPLTRDLTRYAQSLRLSGFQISDQEITDIIQQSIDATLANTQDVRNTWRSAATKDATLQAAGDWQLGALTRNADSLIQSILDTARNRFADEAFTRQQFINIGQELGATGFTGRKIFNTFDKNGRNAALDGQIVDLGESFQAPAAPEFGLPSLRFDRIGQGIETKRGIGRWSGSRSTVRFEYQLSDGTVVYLGTRGAAFDAEGRRVQLPPFWQR